MLTVIRPIGVASMNSYSDEQKKICLKFGADYFPCDDYMMVGISRNFDPTDYPINGLRHPVEEDSTGWYIWSSESFSEEPDFFVSLHAIHVQEGRCPEIVKYLGLAPGWRFLIAPGWEDVWFDPKLLMI